METHFQKELQELKQDLLKMAALVEEAISTAVQSLVKGIQTLQKKPSTGRIRSTGWRSTLKIRV